MVELTTTALLILTAFYGNAPSNVQANAFPKIPVVASATKIADQPLTLEQYVREYFKEDPIMAEIAKCESRFRHIGRNGKVIRGVLTQEDVGVMQINEYFHDDRAKRLGIDLHTLDGNLAYAKWLYGKEGAVPWYSSSKCWEKSATLAMLDTKS